MPKDKVNDMINTTIRKSLNGIAVSGFKRIILVTEFNK